MCEKKRFEILKSKCVHITQDIGKMCVNKGLRKSVYCFCVSSGKNPGVF